MLPIINWLVTADWSFLLFKGLSLTFALFYIIYVAIYLSQVKRMTENYQMSGNPTLVAFSYLNLLLSVLILFIASFFV